MPLIMRDSPRTQNPETAGFRVLKTAVDRLGLLGFAIVRVRVASDRREPRRGPEEAATLQGQIAELPGFARG